MKRALLIAAMVGGLGLATAVVHQHTAEASSSLVHPYRQLHRQQAQPDAGPTAPAAKADDKKGGALPKPDADPVGFFAGLYKYMTSAQWLPLVGGVMILLVFGARKLVEYIKGQKLSKGGRYVVAFGFEALLFLGTAWQAPDASVGDLKLYGAMLATAWAAAGGLEAFSDFAGWLKAKLE